LRSGRGDDLAVVQQPVQDRRGQHVVAEDAAPLKALFEVSRIEPRS
jgi:hypothetical protein